MSRLTTEMDAVDSPAGSLHLLVMAPDAFATYPLPPVGSVTIGRGESADIKLADPLSSRLHARLYLADAIEVEDLGSANGTRVRDQRVPTGRRLEVAVGEGIAIGATVLMVQRTPGIGRPRRLWPHGYFEARLEEECARAEVTDSAFAVARLHVEGAGLEHRCVDAAASALRPADVLAVYGPQEYEVLLVGADAGLARAIVDRWMDALRDAGGSARSSVACYPGDGRNAQALLARVGELLRGDDRRRATQNGQDGQDGPVLNDETLRRTYELARRAAAGTINVLVLGETGVGKEVLAEAIHRMSPRAEKPLVCINCASLSETLLESELFGHERGAFTGATSAKPGLLETAPGGTVFLDEVGELPPGTQAKLLRVIEAREVTRVDGLKARPIDVRFVAATNRDLEADVARGAFRRDLFYRLNGVSLLVPPLRERRTEIEPLARVFVDRTCRQMRRRVPLELSPAALDLLRNYPWPGNVRELRNVIERAVLLCTGPAITPEHLPVEKMGTSAISVPAVPFTPVSSVQPPSMPAVSAPRERPLDERQRILDALEACAWNQTRAARMLRMPRRTFVKRLEKYDLPRPRKATDGM